MRALKRVLAAPPGATAHRHDHQSTFMNLGDPFICPLDVGSSDEVPGER
ncbi:MAG: hypothetical protein ACXVBQ_03840 [Pseudobdellovibrionaceae bacterium]